MTMRVEWRTSGHALGNGSSIDVMRFEVADINQVIKTAAGSSPLYDGLAERGGLPRGTEVLPLSCFAITTNWSAQRLAAGTSYRTYRQVEASVLLAAGFHLWPTSVFDDQSPDPRNEVHYDLIVAFDTNLGLDVMSTGSSAERRIARARWAPHFARLLDLLGPPRELDAPTTPSS